MNHPRRVDGVLLLDKPVGLSSNAALQRARRLLDAAKAGHAGTLDPLASGLLPLCFGEATKFAQPLLEARKGYRATVRFGIATSTGDAEGDAIAHGPASLAREALEAALARFVGRIAQVPPKHAALKFEGRPYYAYARAGIDIPRTARDVEIHALALVDWSPPDAVIDVVCAKGTYVRVLAEDLAETLGTRAHLAALRRTTSGPFEVKDAIGLAALEALDPPQRLALLLPIDAGLSAMPALELDADMATALRQGQRPASRAASGGYRAYDRSGFLGLVDATGEALHARRLVGCADPPAVDPRRE